MNFLFLHVYNDIMCHVVNCIMMYQLLWYIIYIIQASLVSFKHVLVMLLLVAKISLTASEIFRLYIP